MSEDPEIKAMRQELQLYYSLEEKESLRQELAAFRKKYKNVKLIPEPFQKAIAILQQNKVRITDARRKP